jgi:hypothetical protein
MIAVCSIAERCGAQENSPSTIDGFISQRLQEDKLQPSPLCSDAEFVRRVYLDVIGVIPSAAETKAFLNDSSPGKRAKLIDTLLANERYADHWEVMWGDLLREHSASKRKEGTVNGSYRAWLREALEKNIPYDEFARKLITASGSAEENGAVNFYLRDMQNRVESANAVSQVFMGTRMACAQCHDHPFDKWTQTDFHSLMAFFGRTDVTKAGKKKDPAESRVFETESGEYHVPADGDAAVKKKKNNSGEVVTPSFPWNPTETSSGAGPRREALAKFVTGNRQFATVQANRLWGQLMGRGIVEPMDDFQPKNPPSHPELLEFLTDRFVESKLDNKQLIKLILNSDAYQRSSMPTDANRDDKADFSHRVLRRMSAEEMFDSLLVASGYDSGLEEIPAVIKDSQGAGKGPKGVGKMAKKAPAEWAADLPTPCRAGSFMDLFGQPKRDVIVVRRDESGSIPQALELMNGKAIDDAIVKSPLIASLSGSNANWSDIANELYLSAFSRYPTDAELELPKQWGAPSAEQIKDFQWALLNTREFTFVK